jgi:hypothetical protein
LAIGEHVLMPCCTFGTRSTQTRASSPGTLAGMTMHFVKAPLPGSYVVFLPVFAGPYPGAASESEARRRVKRVLREGCDFFLDLTEDGELEPYAHLLPAHVRHVRIGLPRGGVPDPRAMRLVVDTINRASARDGFVVYLHDAEGTGRVGMAVACWVADRPIVSGDIVGFLDRLRADIPGRRPSPETEEQRAFVRGWTRGIEPRPLAEAAAAVRAAGGWVGGKAVDGAEWRQRMLEGGMR